MVREETEHDFRQTGSGESWHPRHGDRGACAKRDRVACNGATISIAIDLVGYSAGGQADALARIIGKQLGENLKVSVVIENNTGANGMIAAQAAARAEPDGYTILMVTDAMVTIDPHLATSNHFDLSKAMEPLINVSWSPLLLAAANNVPANSVAELVALGKQ